MERAGVGEKMGGEATNRQRNKSVICTGRQSELREGQIVG